MSEQRGPRLDTPQEVRRRLIRRPSGMTGETFGVISEQFARFMGTPKFLVWMTVFVTIWLGWNTFAPAPLQFDPRALNYTLLTLMLSLQASYAAPLILLAQNRQEARDRVAVERDRAQAAQSRADMDFLAREIAALRMSVGELATREYLRRELREVLDELEQERADGDRDSSAG